MKLSSVGSSLSIGLLCLLLAWPAPAAAAAPASPALAFALARLAAQEGEVQLAIDNFDEAVRLAPDEPYIRSEYASFLGYVARLARLPATHSQQLARAVEQASAAQRLAPENPDVLRAVSQVYLAAAEDDDKALPQAQAALEALRSLDPADLQALMPLGQIYLHQDRPKDAAAVFEQIVRRAPGNRMAGTLYVEALIKAGDAARAEEVLTRSLASDPGALEPRLSLADLQSQRNDHAAAVATLSAAPPAIAAQPEVRRRLAYERYQDGDLAGAQELVGGLLGEQPDSAFLRTLRALVLTAEGENKEALEDLYALHAADPENPAVTATLTRVLGRDGRHDEAVHLLSDLIRRLAAAGKDDAVARARLDLAELHADAKEWPEVEKVLAPLLAGKEAPALDALLLSADALVHLDRGAEALALLARGDSAEPAVAAKRAEVLLRMERKAEGESALAALAGSGDPRSVLAAARVDQRLERFAGAVPLYQHVLALEPDSLEAAFSLGAACERSGRRDEAVATLRALVAKAPDFAPALNYLGYMWAEKGENLEEAVGLIQHAVTIEPDNGAYVDSLGWARFQQGQYDQAVALLERASRLIPDDATIFEHLGDSYAALGRIEQARDVYRRALSLAQDDGGELRRKLDGLGEPHRRN